MTDLVSTPYYSDELVTLYHGDCLDLAAQWTGADVLVTDPPYGMNAALTRTALDVPIAGDHNTDVRDHALALWGNRPAIVFGHWKKPRPENVKYLGIWDKVHMALGAASAPFATNHEEFYLLGDGAWASGRRPTVLSVPNLLGYSRPDHPTPKPVPLMEQLINVCPLGVIADPFAGSGSTLLAAVNQGRKAIGVELEERYCELIAKRLSNQTMTFDFS